MKNKSNYAAAFATERLREYPEIDALEKALGYSVARDRLELAARVLACPLKVNPPSWQHGRVLYAVASELLESEDRPGLFLDIGTAKGFSACVMTWAVADAKSRRRVMSVDIVDPLAAVPRNSVLEADGETFTVPQFTEPFAAPGVNLTFFGGGSLSLLQKLVSHGDRVRLAFVDGKHNFDVVHAEANCLLKLQSAGDVAVFDDLQIPLVAEAVKVIAGYDFTIVSAGPQRKYAIGVRQ